MTNYEEENNYPKAFLATGIILAVLIGLCYIIVFRTPLPEEQGVGGILVNYGTVDEGTGNNQSSTEEPSVAEKAKKTATKRRLPRMRKTRRLSRQIQKSRRPMWLRNLTSLPLNLLSTKMRYTKELLIKAPVA